jgi:MFS family permease
MNPQSSRTQVIDPRSPPKGLDTASGDELDVPTSDELQRLELEQSHPPRDDHTHELKQSVKCYSFSQPGKWLVLLTLAVLQFFDSWATYASPMGPIRIALKIPVLHETWIINSYLVTFASFNVFFGRVSDLYSPKYVILGGSAFYAILNVCVSFVSDRYSFFVLRALCGVAGAAMAPAAYRIIVHTFQPQERPQAFALYSIAGALSSTFGGTLSGAVSLIRGTGQMASWRWFYRLAAMGALVPAVASWFLIPMMCGSFHFRRHKLRMMDFPGALLLLAATALTIIGLTFGASHGFDSAAFLAPFIIGLLLYPVFFYWEKTRPPYHALIPFRMWTIPNYWILLAYSVPLMSWWASNIVPFMSVYVVRYGEPAWHAAVRMLPSGIAQLITAPLLKQFPALLRLPTLRWTIVAGAIPAIIGYVLFALPSDYATDYWRIVVPGLVLGSAGNIAAFTGTQVAIMAATPPSLSGIVGGMLQTASALGSAISLGAQAGILARRPGYIQNNANLHPAFWFQVAWRGLWLVGFLALGRPSKTVQWDPTA